MVEEYDQAIKTGDGDSNGSDKASMSLRKKALFSLIILASSLFLGFIVLEIYIRFTRQPIDLWIWTGRSAGRNPIAEWASLDAFCAYRPKPSAYVVENGNKTVNSYGFISTPNLKIEKDPGEIRVAFFGGSSTAGTGHDMSDVQTWPWKVAESLQREFSRNKISFINAAAGGYTSFESYGRFYSRVRFFSPDIIVIAHGWNEMYYFSHKKMETIFNWRTLPDGSWSLDEAPQIKIVSPSWIDHFIRYSQLLVYARLILSKKRFGEIAVEALSQNQERDYDQRAIEVWRTNLKLFRESAKVMGMELFVCKQPTLVLPATPTEDQNRFMSAVHGFNYASHVKAFQEIYRVIDEEIPRDRIIDLTRLSGRQEYLYDHVHPTEEGTTMIAQLVAAQLIEYLKNSGKMRNGNP